MKLDDELLSTQQIADLWADSLDEAKAWFDSLRARLSEDIRAIAEKAWEAGWTEATRRDPLYRNPYERKATP